MSKSDYLRLKKSNVQLVTNAFVNNEVIKKQYQKKYNNEEPDVVITNISIDAKQIAVLLYDPDAITVKPYVHWFVVFNEFGQTISLNDFRKNRINMINSSGTDKYYGPNPPPNSGLHHYHLTVYVLDKIIFKADNIETFKSIVNKIKGHVINSDEIIGLLS